MAVEDLYGWILMVILWVPGVFLKSDRWSWLILLANWKSDRKFWTSDVAFLTCLCNVDDVILDVILVELGAFDTGKKENDELKDGDDEFESLARLRDNRGGRGDVVEITGFVPPKIAKGAFGCNGRA
jgi:hypothetical protein